MKYDSVNFDDTVLSLALDDNTLISNINTLKANSEAYYEQIHLKERQEKNKGYYEGKLQIDETKLKDYKARFVDNLIYEGMAYMKPIALSRTPDFSVVTSKDPQQFPNSKLYADSLTKVINTTTKDRENRRALGTAFKHLPSYFVGAIKPRWDPYKDGQGDFVFEAIAPDCLILDHRAKYADPDQMQFIIHKYHRSFRDVVMMLPQAREKLLEHFGIDIESEEGYKEYVEKWNEDMEIEEVWFTDYKEVEPMSGQWEQVECVIWKYKDMVLGKMKNPYWDWQGEEKVMGLEGIDLNALLASTNMGQGLGMELQAQTVFRNYFSEPKKPFIFLSYEQWGDCPYDFTSFIEQVIYLQDNVNTRGRQITDMANRAKKRHVFSSESGVTKENLEEWDLDDPEKDLLIKGDLNKFHKDIEGDQPTAALFQDQDINRNRVFAKMGVNSTTRGTVETDVATTAQLAREADFGRIDDLTEETINNAAQQMAEWTLHFVKLFYTEERFTKVLGSDGNATYVAVTQDMVEDGMEVEITASGVDKVQNQRRAMDMASIKMTDPLTFFEDIGATQPKERAKRMLEYNMEPATYYAEYIMDMSVEEMAQTAGQPAPQGQPAPPEQAAVQTIAPQMQQGSV